MADELPNIKVENFSTDDFASNAMFLSAVKVEKEDEFFPEEEGITTDRDIGTRIIKTEKDDWTSFAESHFVDVDALVKEEDLGIYKEEEERSMLVGSDFCPFPEGEEELNCGDGTLPKTETQGADESFQNDRLSFLQKSENLQTDTSANSRKFSCTKCARTFMSKHTLQKHEVVHSKEKPFSCSWCSRSFKNMSCLRNHVIVHSNEGFVGFLNYSPKPYSYSCTKCAKRFKRRKGLRKHEAAHLEEISCPRCLLSFKRKHLKEHLHFHLNFQDDVNFFCPHCSKNFRNQNELMKHLLLVHSYEKPYLCLKCITSFESHEALKAHLPVHSHGTPLICPQCSAQFVLEGNLKWHLVIHSDISKLLSS